MTWFPQSDYYSDVAAGNVSGRAIMRALGERESWGTTASGEDVWRGNELSSTPSAPASHVLIPTPDAAGESMSVISESAQDDAGSFTGAESVRINYLDATGVEQSIDVVLNGQTAAPIDATIRFVQDMYVLTLADNNVTGTAAGNIRIYKTADDTLVYNMIAAGGNKSLVPHRMVPLAKTLILKGWGAAEANGKRNAFRIRSTDMEGTLIPGVFCFKGVTYLNSSSSPEMELNVKVPALSIVKVSGWATVSNSEGSCYWWGELIDD